MQRRMYKWVRVVFFLLLLLFPGTSKREPYTVFPGLKKNPLEIEVIPDSFRFRVVVPYAVEIGHYFEFLDSLVQRYDTLISYPLSEHILVRANPWIIDTLAETDYYRQIKQGIFIFSQEKQVVLHPGDTLGIPDSLLAMQLLDKLDRTTLDVNIPEFTLRIIEGQDTLFRFPVRVGQNKSRYLEMAGRVMDLRTDIGTGKIVRIERNPAWINPVDCKPYTVTRRDDGKLTSCPRIPWLEPEINGKRGGDLIHPTTNPRTLGKAYSNGCVGMREADSWYVYYHAPIGTRVVFRYDLQVVNDTGAVVRLRDIYRLKK